MDFVAMLLISVSGHSWYAGMGNSCGVDIFYWATNNPGGREMLRASPVILLLLVGCTKSADDLAKDFDRVKTGATIAEVQAQLGSGEEIAEDKLPTNFKKV